MPIAKPYDGAGKKVLCQYLASAHESLIGLMQRYLCCHSEEEREKLEDEMLPKLAQLIGLRDKGQLQTDGLPAPLRTPKAIELWRKAYRTGLVDDSLQPTGTRQCAALLADHIASKLKLVQRWKHFETFWGIKNLRADYNKAFSSNHYDDMIDPIIQALGEIE